MRLALDYGFTRAKQMLAFPLTRTTTSKDGKTVTIEPVGWSLHTAIRLAKEGTQIGRLACEVQSQLVEAGVDGQTRLELMESVMRELEKEGYEVRRRDDWLMDEDEGSDDDMPFTRVAMIDALRADGFLVVPPVKKVGEG